MLAGARESFIKTFFISEIDFACLELTCNVGFFQWCIVYHVLQGLLSLDGEIAPILYHLVRSHKTDKLLDQTPPGAGKRIMAK